MEKGRGVDEGASGGVVLMIGPGDVRDSVNAVSREERMQCGVIVPHCTAL